MLFGFLIPTVLMCTNTQFVQIIRALPDKKLTLAQSLLEKLGEVYAVKGTTIKEAIRKFEDRTGTKASEAKIVNLIAEYPPIEEMDDALSTLVSCEWLTLSTNAIESISNLDGLKKLKILFLGRNNIKSLTGLEAVGDTLEELRISYNFIEKLEGINVLKKLKVLYMSHNQVKDMEEFDRLAALPRLEELLFVGNPLEEKLSAIGTWKDKVVEKLPKLKKLDGEEDILETAYAACVNK